VFRRLIAGRVGAGKTEQSEDDIYA